MLAGAASLGRGHPGGLAWPAFCVKEVGLHGRGSRRRVRVDPKAPGGRAERGFLVRSELRGGWAWNGHEEWGVENGRGERRGE